MLEALFFLAIFVLRKFVKFGTMALNIFSLGNPRKYMSNKQADLLLQLVEALDAAGSSVKAAEQWAQKRAKELGVPPEKVFASAQEASSLMDSADVESGRVIEGAFDGQNMIDGEGNIYPVPANYASKSKLVEGDKLKLTIADNGAFIYKQIDLVPRKLLVGHLVIDGSQYQVLADKKVFNVLYASVTFYRARVGDQVTIIVPEEGVSKHAAIENVIPQSVVESSAVDISKLEVMA